MGRKFSSRLGFILISAGCAIRLGNVWRFSIVGQYGGAAFVLIYAVFLVTGSSDRSHGILQWDGQTEVWRCPYDVLEPKERKWHYAKYLGMAGNYILMMFYTGRKFGWSYISSDGRLIYGSG